MIAKFDLFDTTNHLVASFVTYNEALSYKICIAGRPEWTIKRKDYQSTKKQQNFVRQIESYLNIPFKGNINSGLQCSQFISIYKSDYISFINDLIGDSDCLGY